MESGLPMEAALKMEGKNYNGISFYVFNVKEN